MQTSNQKETAPSQEESKIKKHLDLELKEIVSFFTVITFILTLHSILYGIRLLSLFGINSPGTYFSLTDYIQSFYFRESLLWLIPIVVAWIGGSWASHTNEARGKTPKGLIPNRIAYFIIAIFLLRQLLALFLGDYVEFLSWLHYTSMMMVCSLSLMCVKYFKNRLWAFFLIAPTAVLFSNLFLATSIEYFNIVNNSRPEKIELFRDNSVVNIHPIITGCKINYPTVSIPCVIICFLYPFFLKGIKFHEPKTDLCGAELASWRKVCQMIKGTSYPSNLCYSGNTMKIRFSFFVFSFFLFALGCCLFMTAPGYAAQGKVLKSRDTWRDVTVHKKGGDKSPLDYSLSAVWDNAQILTFTHAMVAPESIGKPIPTDKLPLSMTPQLQWGGTWLDQYTLQLTNKTPLPLATKLTYAPRGSVKSLNNYELTRTKEFVPYPFAVSAPNQASYNEDATVTYEMVFTNGQVAPEQLKKHMTLAALDGTPIPVQRVTADKNKPSSLFFTFRAPLGDKVRFTLEKGLIPVNGALPLEQTITKTLQPQPMIAITAIADAQDAAPPWNRFIRIETSSPVKPEVLKKYLQLSPQMDVTLESEAGTSFSLKGDFSTRPRVTVTLQKGMPTADNTGRLSEDHKHVVMFTDFPPNLALGEQGTLASPKNNVRVPLTTINVEKVEVSLRELPANSIPLMAMGFFDGYRADLAHLLSIRTADVGGVLNRISERSLDIAELAEGRRGIFFLTVTDASQPENTPSLSLMPPSRDANVAGNKAAARHTDDGSDYGEEEDQGGSGIPSQRKAQKVVIISDIGLMARLMPGGLTVWANSLATAKPLEGTLIRVYSAKNMLLAEGRTDTHGIWRFTPEQPWSYADKPAIIIATTPAGTAVPAAGAQPAAAKTAAAPKAAASATNSGSAAQNATAPAVGATTAAVPASQPRQYDDMTYLLLNNTLVQGNAFDIGGKPYLTEGYEAFCYTPRGVFRPGETVPFHVLVRDNTMSAPPAFPLGWKVTSSTGRTAGQGVVPLSAAGGADFSLPLVPAAATGEYRLSVFLPGQEERSLGGAVFSVEDLVPPRIEVQLTPEAPLLVGREPSAVAIAARYLFGTPAADAPWKASIHASPRAFSHPDWKAFSFPAGQSRQERLPDQDGVLDTEGKGSIALDLSELPATPQNIQLTVFVTEDGGRDVAKSLTLPFYPEPVLLGYALPRQDATAQSPATIQVAAVTPDGKPLERASITARIALQRYYYARSERGNDEFTEQKKLLTLAVPLKNGVGQLTFTPEEEGEYVINLVDESTGVEQLLRLNVWPGLVGSPAGASPIIDKVMFTWDKKSYAPGEVARLGVRAPFAGTALLVVENDKERLTRVFTLDHAETTLDVPVMADMAPNAYCSLWVIRPIVEGQPWAAHRAFGVSPLLLRQEKAQLTVRLDAPARVLPKTDVPIVVTLTDNQGKPVAGEVTVALVDEGLLALSNHPTPNPFAFFSARRALVTRFFDRYDELLPLTALPPLTFATGGDGEDEDMSRASPITRKLELLSIMQATIATGADGTATTTLSLPEYSGTGRLMVVGASPAAVGSAAASMQIARDVTVEVTPPRMVAPGDSFLIPVILYGADASPRTATVTLSTEGPLAVQGQTDLTVRLGKDTPKESLLIPVRAQEGVALGAFVVTTTIQGKEPQTFVQRYEIPVRPPYGRTTRAESGVVTGKAPAQLKLDDAFVAGSHTLRLQFSTTPDISLMSAFDYLKEYPHGCLEQTVSTTWPYLGAPAMLRALTPELAESTVYKAALDFGIRRILSMQRPDGGFVMWPGDNMHSSSAFGWGSAYAVHLLTEARAAGQELVPNDAFRAAIKWLKRALSAPLKNTPGYGGDIGYELSTRAYIAYVLTLNGEPPLGWMQFLRDQGDTLNTSARIFLAGAYALAEGKPDALRVLGTVPFKENSFGWSFESASRNEALRLLMWVQVEPFAKETAELAARVLADGQNGRWTNTQENAVAVMALGLYAEKTAGSKKPFTAHVTTVDAHGKPVVLASFDNEHLPRLDGSVLLPTEGPAQPVTIAVHDAQGKPGEGILYYSLLSSGVPHTAPPPKAQGLRVLTRWTLPDDTKVNGFIHHKNGTIDLQSRNATVQQGDKITVTLFLDAPEAINSLVLTDIAPGGFEVENPSLVALGRRPAGDADDTDYADAPASLQEEWALVNDTPPFGGLRLLNGMTGVRAETRDDRLLLYVNTLPKRSAFTYTLRAVTKGSFILPPTVAEGMYDTSIQAVTLPGTVTIVEQK